MIDLCYIINPVCFYALILIQNSLVKTTYTTFLCSTAFIPSLIYTILKMKNFNTKKISFEIIFYGMLFSALDFFAFYILFHSMSRFSSFMVISMTSFFFLTMCKVPTHFIEFIFDWGSILVVIRIFKKVIDYERSDFQFYHYSFGSDLFYIIYLFYIPKVFAERFALQDLDEDLGNNCKILFFMIISGIYLLIDIVNTRQEGLYGKDHYSMIILMSIISFVWLITLKKITPELCDNYLISCAVILVIYFMYRADKIFDVTRIEANLYNLYIFLFIALVVLYFYIQIDKIFLVDEIANLLNKYNSPTTEGANIQEERTNTENEAALYALYTT